MTHTGEWARWARLRDRFRPDRWPRMMGLTMVQRQAVTWTNATRYKRADTTGKGLILDELCTTTGWHRNHAGKALSQALTPRLVRPRAPRRPIYGAEIIAALAFCWAVLGVPTGQRLAPITAELVPTLRRFQDPPVSQRPQLGAPLEMRHRATAFTHRLVNGPSMGAGQNGGSSGSTRRPSVGVSVPSHLAASESVDPL